MKTKMKRSLLLLLLPFPTTKVQSYNYQDDFVKDINQKSLCGWLHVLGYLHTCIRLYIPYYLLYGISYMSIVWYKYYIYIYIYNMQLAAARTTKKWLEI